MFLKRLNGKTHVKGTGGFVSYFFKGNIMWEKFIWLVVIVLAVGSHCMAGFHAWGEGLWNDPATWDSSRSPGAGDSATLMAHSTVNISGTEEAARELSVSVPIYGPDGRDVGPAYINISDSGVLHVEDELTLGIGMSTGIINVYDSSELTANCDITLAFYGGSGHLNVYGGNVTTTGWLNVGGTAEYGFDGGGTVNIYGGVVNAKQYWIAYNSTINLAGGVLRVNEDWESYGLMLHYVRNGMLVAYGGTSEVYYQVVDGYAEIMAIPEPATISLLGLGMFAILRRRR